MIRYLEINNFKSLLHFASPFSRLNLFFGLNGAGKSSVIQALLLLRQTYLRTKSECIAGLYLNDSLINLGTAKDILCQNASEDEICFDILFDLGLSGGVSFFIWFFSIKQYFEKRKTYER